MSRVELQYSSQPSAARNQGPLPCDCRYCFNRPSSRVPINGQPTRPSFRSMYLPTCSKVQTEVRLCSNNFAPLHEFISPKLVALLTQPSQLRPSRSTLSRSDSVEPVVSRDKVAAWIANNWNVEFPHCVDNVFAETVPVNKMIVRIVGII